MTLVEPRANCQRGDVSDTQRREENEKKKHCKTI